MTHSNAKIILSVTHALSMKRWWNDTDRINPKYSDKNLSTWHFVLQKPHTDLSGIKNPALRIDGSASNSLIDGRAASNS
jgi:hypothetical protein